LKFCDISRVSEAITAKRMNIDPYCQHRNCCPLYVLFSDVQIALISQVLLQLGGVKPRWCGKNKSSYTHGCRVLTCRWLGFLVCVYVAYEKLVTSTGDWHERHTVSLLLRSLS